MLLEEPTAYAAFGLTDWIKGVELVDVAGSRERRAHWPRKTPLR
jgi:hypothetical protein